MKEVEMIGLITSYQGAPLVHHSYLIKKGNNIVCLCVDMQSKRTIIDAIGSGPDGPSLLIGANKYSSGLMKGIKRDIPTEIMFEGYGEEWNIFSASSDKWTINVCLIKDR